MATAARYETSSKQRWTAGAWVDRAGTIVGLTCAVHCLLAPVLLGALMAARLDVLAGAPLETVFVITSVAMAAFAAATGIRRHRDWRILAAFIAAIGSLLVGRLGEETFMMGEWLAIAGALGIAGTHILNARSCRHCELVCSRPHP